MKVLGNSKLSGKFQVTIPKLVREALKVRDGDLLVFVNDEGHICLKRGRIQFEA